MTEHHDLRHLGSSDSEPPASPFEAEVEAVPDPYPESAYVVRFTVPEFTSLCPITGQPDFAFFMLDYVPDGMLLESKSFKLFLASFRNHGAFHEDCTLTIAKRVEGAIQPRWLRLGGYWYPRGGMPIDIFYQSGEPPADVWIPAQDVASYRGRP